MPTVEADATKLRNLAIAAGMSEGEFNAACQHVINELLKSKPASTPAPKASDVLNGWVAGSEDPRDRVKRKLFPGS